MYLVDVDDDGLAVDVGALDLGDGRDGRLLRFRFGGVGEGMGGSEIRRRVVWVWWARGPTQQRAPRAVKLPREGKGRQTHLDLRRVERGERLDGGGLEVEHQHVVVVEVHVLLGVLLRPVGTRTGGWMV